MSVFIVGNLTINYFFLSPGREMVRAAERDLHEMEETYIQLKAADMAEISKSLKQQVDYLNEKLERIAASRLTNERVPLLVARLEREAEGAGLTVTTNIKRTKKTPNLIKIDVNLTGTLVDFLSYFGQLARWEKHLFVKDFRIYNRNPVQNTLNGKMEFVLLIEHK